MYVIVTVQTGYSQQRTKHKTVGELNQQTTVAPSIMTALCFMLLKPTDSSLLVETGMSG